MSIPTPTSSQSSDLVTSPGPVPMPGSGDETQGIGATRGSGALQP